VLKPEMQQLFVNYISDLTKYLTNHPDLNKPFEENILMA
jgi:hypothetical protein